MVEKRAIIDELLARARIYVGEQVDMVIKTIQGFDEVPESCSRCGCIMNKVYFRSKEPTEIWNAYNLAVLKYEKCGKAIAEPKELIRISGKA